MVLGDFNSHHPSSPEQGMKGQRQRGEALDAAINILQLAIMNQGLLTRLPPGPALLASYHLLPDATWFTLTTLGSDHLPKTITPRPRSGKRFYELPQG